jgi:hypothetical protein
VSERFREDRRRTSPVAAPATTDNERQAGLQGQQMARVNIGADEWKAFRALAILRSRSVAEYLGHLVLKELRRVERRRANGSAVAKATLSSDGDAVAYEVPSWEP